VSSLRLTVPNAALLKISFLTFLVLTFFILMSGIDFIVHGTLYSYGLKFSFKWAVIYWSFYNTVFLCFALIVGYVYWFGSRRTKQDFKISLCLSMSIIVLAVAGLQDVIGYVFWQGGLPPDSVAWWWAPWYQIFGFWTSSSQLILTMVSVSSVVLLWVYLFQKSFVHTVRR